MSLIFDVAQVIQVPEHLKELPSTLPLSQLIGSKVSQISPQMKLIIENQANLAIIDQTKYQRYVVSEDASRISNSPKSQLII